MVVNLQEYSTNSKMIVQHMIDSMVNTDLGEALPAVTKSLQWAIKPSLHNNESLHETSLY